MSTWPANGAAGSRRFPIRAVGCGLKVFAVSPMHADPHAGCDSDLIYPIFQSSIQLFYQSIKFKILKSLESDPTSRLVLGIRLDLKFDFIQSESIPRELPDASNDANVDKAKVTRSESNVESVIRFAVWTVQSFLAKVTSSNPHCHF